MLPINHFAPIKRSILSRKVQKKND